jgi:hypothetical protein
MQRTASNYLKTSDYFRFIFYKSYIYGRDKSDVQRAAQIAMRAEKDGYDEQVVVGVFLRDIGHLITAEVVRELQLESVDSIQNLQYRGVKNYELIGHDVCRFFRLPEITCKIVLDGCTVSDDVPINPTAQQTLNIIEKVKRSNYAPYDPTLRIDDQQIEKYFSMIDRVLIV